MIAGAYWMMTDALYFPERAHFERERIDQFRHRQTLKNGVYPPTKDSLEEEKFILLMRRLVAEQERTTNLEEIQAATIPQAIECLERWLLAHEAGVTQGLDGLERQLDQEGMWIAQRMWDLRINPAPASRLFAYERLEKEVIDNSIYKANQKMR